jgi:hypothetical protein
MSQDYPQTNQPKRKDSPPVYNQDQTKNNPDKNVQKPTEERNKFGDRVKPEDTKI